MTKKIALTGKMRSGKDAVADRLYFEHDFAFPISFGLSLKALAHDVFLDVPKEPKPRELYQFMNKMREFDEDVWVKHLAKHVEIVGKMEPERGIVVTDARQPNEIRWLQDNGFYIVRVNATDENRRKRMEEAEEEFTEDSLNHDTERYVDNLEVDADIDNNGSIDELQAKVDEIVKGLE